MSRSKRAPVATEGYGKDRKVRKRRANRKVRKAKDVASGSAFKKESESWNICDWRIPGGDGPKATRK
jgi:hypothetical protein